jgi:uncharacterized membrane protein YeaQ/YmgE (transglycosylase-associated protein family)
MIGSIVIGFVIGIVARFLRPGPDPMGFIMTTILGIIGSLLASFIGQKMGMYQAGQSAGFIFSVIGSIIVLAIYHMIARKSDLP